MQNEKMKVSRNSRIEVRVAEEEKNIIEHAAILSGVSFSDFVRLKLIEDSRAVIRDHEVIRLTREGSLAMAEALLNPPEPNEALRGLLSTASEIPSARQ